MSIGRPCWSASVSRDTPARAVSFPTAKGACPAAGTPRSGPTGPTSARTSCPTLLCLCPNHHIEFDRFAICIEEDWTVRRNSTGVVEYELKLHADHVIEQDHIRYHRALCGHR
ncbi:HNH endonuclease [Streptomyces cyaneofuscatus]|uniref:HNH endonuclease n=1 Tax=Streptomyces cyaneofuscatus TaxID=66883 RepID=UPI0036C51DE7